MAERKKKISNFIFQPMLAVLLFLTALKFQERWTWEGSDVSWEWQQNPSNPAEPFKQGVGINRNTFQSPALLCLCLPPTCQGEQGGKSSPGRENKQLLEEVREEDPVKCHSFILRSFLDWTLSRGRWEGQRVQRGVLTSLSILVHKVWLVWIKESLAYSSGSLSLTFSNTV